jgi:4-hydroxy-tetrahydrodipicolinate synthase
MFFGSIPALVTPFSGGRVAEDTMAELVEWQIAQGSNALVPCGTTGEVATLTAEEHRRVIEITVSTARGRVPVIAGAGTYSTAASIERMRVARELGADAALAVVPYYNRPSQAGLAAHFRALAESSDLPTVVAVKDATGNLGRVTAQRLACGARFCQLSGNDDMALGFNAMGGVGCISVTANVAPRLCADFQEATREGRWDEAMELQDRLYPLHAALFTDASPAPAKYALTRVRPGFDPELRLPLVEASEASKRAVDAALEHAGLV